MLNMNDQHLHHPLHQPNNHPSPARAARAAGFALALLGAVALAAALHPALARSKAYKPAFVLDDQVREEVNTSAFAMILGEVRASMADLMWIKTERYLHRGVIYKPHLDADAVAHTGELVARHEDHDDGHDHETASAESHDGHDGDADHDEHGHEGEKLVAMIPDREHDYRGFIGILQREIQPWKGPDEPDEHTAGDELVPWYRMLTYSDPHHWRGYMIGTWWLSKMQDPQALREANAFIAEGIKNNPEAFQLNLMAGRLKIQQQRWREAIGCFERAMQIALKTRPAGGKETPPIWSLSDEEDFAAAARYIPNLLFHKLNDLPAARASLAQALQLLPTDAPLQALQKQLDAAPK